MSEDYIKNGWSIAHNNPPERCGITELYDVILFDGTNALGLYDHELNQWINIISKKTLNWVVYYRHYNYMACKAYNEEVNKAQSLPQRNTFIYYLIDPITDSVMYVGQSYDPAKRFRNHCSSRASKKIRDWVLSLRSKNLRPILSVAEEVEYRKIFFIERQHIQLQKESNPNILNTQNL